MRDRPRIEKFRLEIANAIPRFPNDRASLQHMEKKRLTDLLIDYVAWRSRYVGVRPRTVAIEPAAQADPKWPAMSVAIDAFLAKVRQGKDLTPHLSIMPHTRGYTPGARAPGASADDRWSDKDFLLNTMGYHHFHLDAAEKKGGHRKGSDELIFAEVTRDTFRLVAIFGHNVFKLASTERNRLTDLHHEIASRGAPPGAVVIGSTMLMTSGHTLHSVRYADRCAQLLKEMDPQMDDSGHVKSWFAVGGVEAPKNPKFEWIFMHLDLGFVEKTTQSAFWVQQGWN